MTTAAESGGWGAVESAFRMHPEDVPYLAEAREVLAAFPEKTRDKIYLKLLDGDYLGKRMSELIVAVRALGMRRNVLAVNDAAPAITDEEIDEAFAAIGVDLMGSFTAIS